MHYLKYPISCAKLLRCRFQHQSQPPNTKETNMSASPEHAVRPGRERCGRAGNPGMDGRAVGGHRERRPRARPFPAGATARACAPEQHGHAVFGQHRLCQHDRADRGRTQPRQPRTRRPPARLYALECDGHGGQGQSAAPGRRRRPGRPHQFVRVAGPHVRGRLQPFLARRERRPRRRSAVYPGPFGARYLRPRLPRRAPDAKSSCSTSARKSTARACRAIRIPS